jgi:putative FmdB family regulatory protein
MPLLEYRCSDCGSLFERLVPTTAGADTTDCPRCSNGTGRRVLSLFAAVRGGDGNSTASVAAGGGGCCGGSCGCGR